MQRYMIMVSSVTEKELQDLTCLYLTINIQDRKGLKTLKIETSCKDRVPVTEEHFNNGA